MDRSPMPRYRIEHRRANAPVAFLGYSDSWDADRTAFAAYGPDLHHDGVGGELVLVHQETRTVVARRDVTAPL